MRLQTIPLPEDLHDRVSRLAERDERTRPAEIRWLLLKAVEAAERASATAFGQLEQDAHVG
jgi:predicted transcriptional regulator